MSDRTSPGLRPASSVSEYYERYWLPPDRRPPDVTRPQLIDTPFPAVARLFESNDQVLDAEEVYALAQAF